MSGFGRIAEIFAKMKQMEQADAGPGQQYVYNPGSQTYGGMKKGGTVKSSASKRGDGCAQRGKTRA
jgi:hypothetical protein